MGLKNDPNCTLCALHKTANTVCLLGEGPKQCDVMIIGEAPGQREDDSGRPFVGQSGKLLMEMLAKAGFDRKDVFITNAVSCRPPGNATPSKKEIAACRKWLQYQIAMVKPKFVLTLGNVPLLSLLGLTGIKKLRGKPIKKDGMVILPTFHPSFALRDPTQRPIIERDIQTFRDIVDFGDVPYERGLNYSIIDTWPKFRAMLGKLHGVVAFDLETSGLYAWGLRPLIRDKDKNVIGQGKREKTWITSIILGTATEQFVIPLNHSQLQLTPKGWIQPKCPSYATDPDGAREFMGRMALKNENAQQDLWDELVPVLDDCELVGQNMKFDVVWTWVKTGHRLTIGFDTMLAHYNLNENSIHDLEFLAAFYLGAKGYDIPLHEKHGFGPLDRHCQYGASDGYYTRKLRFVLKDALDAESASGRLFYNVTLPSANLFCEIEYHGVYINTAKMADAEKFLRELVAEAMKEWNKWGKGVNLASPKQVGKLLYDKLKIKCPQLTPKGGRSTSESTLNQIDHPCVASLLKYRGAAQQLSFFIDGWKPYIINSRLHPSFKLHGTVTGRPSCENPNLQQVPRDTRIRSLVCAAPGRALLEADLSQIELRLAAWMAEERNMIQLFMEGVDVHWKTMIASIKSNAGGYAEHVMETAKLYCVQEGLPPDGPSTAILLNVWKFTKEIKNTQTLLRTCREDGGDQTSGSGKRWISGRSTQSKLEERLEKVAGQKISEKGLRALQQYQIHFASPQGQSRKKLEKIEFTDALSLLSFIGPSIATKLCDEWKEGRKKAKAVAFGYLYGMWWKKFKQYARDNYQVEVTDDEAQESRISFFETYPDFEAWHKVQKRYARMNGFVKNPIGRKRRLPAATHKDDTPERREAERQAVNSPVQSFASDLNLMAALQLRKEFTIEVLKMYGTIHDAILIDVREDMVKPVAKRILEIMEGPDALKKIFNVEIDVPIKGEVKVGAWSEGKDVEFKEAA